MAAGVIDAILAQAEKIAALDLMFRPGIRRGTRECVMTHAPYILIYRTGSASVGIARIIHQRSEYFQRPR